MIGTGFSHIPDHRMATLNHP